MRILLLYASAGGGHKRAAQAMEAYFRVHLPGAEVRVEDALRHVGRAVNALCCDGYKFSAKHAPQIFGTLYRSTNRDTKFAALLPRVNGMLARKLLPLIEEFRPDVILDTYHFAGQMVSRLKEKGLVSAPLVNVVTDYGPHMAWLAPEVDAYVVAEDGLRDAFVRMGAPKEKIHTFGIPIFEAFYQEEDRASLLRGMNLSPELPTVLIMAGSFGVKNILRVYRDISTLGTAFQVIVITGKNKTLYEAFQKELPNSSKPTHLVEFTTEVQKYMHASDLLITKPGGLTVSEALASGLPMAVFDAIPGQEEDNAQFLQAHGMGVRLKSGASCAFMVRSLLQDPRRLADMRAACKAFDKSDCCQNILSLLQELTNGKREST